MYRYASLLQGGCCSSSHKSTFQARRQGRNKALFLKDSPPQGPFPTPHQPQLGHRDSPSCEGDWEMAYFKCPVLTALQNQRSICGRTSSLYITHLLMDTRAVPRKAATAPCTSLSWVSISQVSKDPGVERLVTSCSVENVYVPAVLPSPNADGFVSAVFTVGFSLPSGADGIFAKIDRVVSPTPQAFHSVESAWPCGRPVTNRMWQK